MLKSTFENRAAAALRQVTDDLAPDFDTRYSQLLALRRLTHQAIASALQGPLNVRLAEMPHDDLNAKRKLSSWLNERLRNLGLTIRCQRTGRSAILIASAYHADDTDGRFRLEVREESGRTRRTLSSRNLPDIELMAHPVRVESFSARYRRRAGRGDSPAR